MFIAIGAVGLLVVAIIVFVVKGGSSQPGEQSIIGTWYSNRPDTLTFSEDGTYTGDGRWLNSGTYSIDGSTITTTGTLDGECTLTISEENGKIVIQAYEFTYYATEEEAAARIEKDKQELAESEANIVPNTEAAVLGEWQSKDGTATLSFTETTFTIQFKGNANVPAETATYEYKIIDDKSMEITKDGITTVAQYTFTTKNGEQTIYCSGFEYAKTFVRPAPDTGDNSGVSGASSNQDNSRVGIENPDVGEYEAELAATVDAALIGTWRGTYDEFETSDTVYWVYVFNKNGTFSFTNGETSMSGTYTTSHDPNNNNYHSTLHLKLEDGTTKDIPFYFSGTNPISMSLGTKKDPIYKKQ